jgi:hypothetical protein
VIIISKMRVFIEGVSGIGKTSLVRDFPQLMRKTKGYEKFPSVILQDYQQRYDVWDYKHKHEDIEIGLWYMYESARSVIDLIPSVTLIDRHAVSSIVYHNLLSDKDMKLPPKEMDLYGTLASELVVILVCPERLINDTVYAIRNRGGMDAEIASPEYNRWQNDRYRKLGEYFHWPVLEYDWRNPKVVNDYVLKTLLSAERYGRWTLRDARR